MEVLGAMLVVGRDIRLAYLLKMGAINVLCPEAENHQKLLKSLKNATSHLAVAPVAK